VGLGRFELPTLGLESRSSTFKEFRKRIDEVRGPAELLIESGKLAAAHSKGQVN